MSAALVRMMAFHQEQKLALRGPGGFFGRMAAQPLEALPVGRLSGLLHMLRGFFSVEDKAIPKFFLIEGNKWSI
jgi:hypothetical protein